MKRKVNPVVIEEERVLVDCYRFKIEITDEGLIRVYAFNSRDKGDVEIILSPFKILLTKEIDGKLEEILKGRMAEIVYKKVLEEENIKDG